MKKIIVIGAGVSGLSAAIRLQHAGYDVTIYDALDKAGGKMNTVEFDGFQFDLGPTIVMMPDIYDGVFKETGANPADYYKMSQLETMYTVHYSDGTTIPVSQNKEKFYRVLESVESGISIQYDAYMEEMKKRFKVAEEHFITRAFRSPSDLYNFKMITNTFKLKTFSSAYNSIARFIKNEKIRQLVAFQTLYIGISPFQGPSIYNIIPLIQTMYGVHYIEGGMYAYAQALERLFLERGGVIHYNTEVSSIIIENKRATGIVVQGEVLPAECILNTADFPYALKHLLPEGFKQQRYQKSNIEKQAYSASCALVYATVKGDIPNDVDMHNIFLSSHFEKNIESIFSGDLYEESSVYTYIPAVQDKTLAPEGYFGMYILMPVANLKDGSNIDWSTSETRSKVLQIMYQRLQKNPKFSVIVDKIEKTEMITPLDFQAKFHTLYGETFGLKPSLLQSNYFRPQPKAWSVEQLYFAGASIHPGAGVPIVLTSAKLAVEEIMQDDR